MILVDFNLEVTCAGSIAMTVYRYREARPEDGAVCYLGGHWKRDIILTVGPPMGDVPAQFGVGAYSRRGVIVPEFLFRRAGGSWPMAGFFEPVEKFDMTCAYGGVWVHQFGHFLIETMCRVWWLRNHPHLPIVWHSKNGIILEWQRQILDLLGIKNRIILLNEAAIFENIVLPDPGIMIDSFFSAVQEHALAQFQFKEPILGKKIWLSRARLPHNLSKIEGELSIESELVERGWIIFCPERHSIWEQLDVMADAELIGGFDGSAFHALILARGVRAEIRMISREGKRPNASYRLISEMKGITQSELVVEADFVSGNGRNASWKINGRQEILDYLLA